MATVNPFDLLGDDDNDDPSQLIAAQQKAATVVVPPTRAKKALTPTQPSAHPPPSSQAKMPSKPLPPAQAVREGNGERGGRNGGGRGSGRGRGGFMNRDSYGNNENNVIENGFGGEMEKPSERGRGGYRGGPYRGVRRGGYSNGEVEEGDRAPRRMFDRHSGTGRGNGFKRDGSGRGNWGSVDDQEPINKPEEIVDSMEKNLALEEKPLGEEEGVAVNKESTTDVPEEKEPEEKEMTLDEYEKVLEEKRKSLQALVRTEERKVDVDKEFESMQQLSAKKGNDDIFIKLGSEKELAKRKEIADKEEKAKKSVSINEFLKPAEGGRSYSPGGRGRGRGDRGFRGGFGGSNLMRSTEAPSIEDPGQFPSLVGK